MSDVQSERDNRQLPIDRVGVKDLKYPIVVLDRANGVQHTVASVAMTVNLPHHFRGTHMSRFIEILNETHQELHIDKIGDVLRSMKERLDAEEAHIEIEFPYFIEKTAPVSGAKSLMVYPCTYVGTLGIEADFILKVEVPVTTLCPCSKEMSRYGAHNQRSGIRMAVRTVEMVWIEELVDMAEQAASSPLYALLKREDEKAVTEAAYERPMFVEDVVRDVALKLNADSRIIWYQVASENMESIHNHNAFASIQNDKRSP